MIAGAQERIVMDMFLFNPDMANRPEHVRVAETITCALIERRRQCRDCASPSWSTPSTAITAPTGRTTSDDWKPPGSRSWKHR